MLQSGVDPSVYAGLQLASTNQNEAANRATQAGIAGQQVSEQAREFNLHQAFTQRMATFQAQADMLRQQAGMAALQAGNSEAAQVELQGIKDKAAEAQAAATTHQAVAVVDSMNKTAPANAAAVLEPMRKIYMGNKVRQTTLAANVVNGITQGAMSVLAEPEAQDAIRGVQGLPTSSEQQLIAKTVDQKFGLGNGKEPSAVGRVIAGGVGLLGLAGNEAVGKFNATTGAPYQMTDEERMKMEGVADGLARKVFERGVQPAVYAVSPDSKIDGPMAHAAIMKYYDGVHMKQDAARLNDPSGEELGRKADAQMQQGLTDFEKAGGDKYSASAVVEGASRAGQSLRETYQVEAAKQQAAAGGTLTRNQVLQNELMARVAGRLEDHVHAAHAGLPKYDVYQADKDMAVMDEVQRLAASMAPTAAIHAAVAALPEHIRGPAVASDVEGRYAGMHPEVFQANKEAMRKGEADQFAAKQVTMANEVKGQRRISQKEFEARTPYAEAYAKLAADLLGGGR